MDGDERWVVGGVEGRHKQTIKIQKKERDSENNKHTTHIPHHLTQERRPQSSIPQSSIHTHTTHDRLSSLSSSSFIVMNHWARLSSPFFISYRHGHQSGRASEPVEVPCSSTNHHWVAEVQCQEGVVEGNPSPHRGYAVVRQWCNWGGTSYAVVVPAGAVDDDAALDGGAADGRRWLGTCHWQRRPDLTLRGKRKWKKGTGSHRPR